MLLINNLNVVNAGQLALLFHPRGGGQQIASEGRAQVSFSYMARALRQASLLMTHLHQRFLAQQRTWAIAFFAVVLL